MTIKQRVFLSSVPPGLGKFQNNLYQAINALDDYCCVRVEEFGDTDTDAASDLFCRAIASDCDIFMLSLGEDYGAVHEATGKSYAEREYDAAIQADIPLVSFYVPEKIESLYLVREEDLPRERQKAFRERVQNKKETDWRAPILDLGAAFTGIPEELMDHVVKAALKGMKSHLKYIHDLREWERKAGTTPALRGKTWLLFQFLTNQNGFDTGVSITNISLDPIGLTMPQVGRACVHFYGQDAPPPYDTCSILPGSVFSMLLSTPAPGFQGYAVAECNFFPARGAACVMRLGGNDPTIYCAEVFHTEPPKGTYTKEPVGWEAKFAVGE